MKVDSVSLAAPMYNEAINARELILAWEKHLKSSSYLREFEIVICDDGSTDDTSAILKELIPLVPSLRIVRHSKNKGAGAAIKDAIMNTSKQWVLTIDSDGQFPIENIDLLVQALENSETLAAFGARQKKEGSLFERLGSYSSGLLCNLIHESNLSDFNCALKLVEGNLVRSICLEAQGQNYSTDLTSKLIERGIAFTETSVSHLKRNHRHLSRKSFFKLASDRFLFVLYLFVRRILSKRRIIE